MPIVRDAWEFHVGPPNGATGLTLEIDLPESLEVLIDRRPMRQILINLFAEAVRRSDARGTVGFGATVDGDLVQIEVYLRGRPGQLYGRTGVAADVLGPRAAWNCTAPR